MAVGIFEYKNTCVYKIACKDTNITNTYVGVTTNFNVRRLAHISCCRTLKKGKLYDCIRENGGWDNWEMVIVEKFGCFGRKSAIERERYWYDMLKPDLNSNYPSRTHEEWYEHKKENRSSNKKFLLL